jgi:hypothetical protein
VSDRSSARCSARCSVRCSAECVAHSTTDTRRNTVLTQTRKKWQCRQLSAISPRGVCARCHPTRAFAPMHPTTRWRVPGAHVAPASEHPLACSRAWRCQALRQAWVGLPRDEQNRACITRTALPTTKHAAAGTPLAGGQVNRATNCAWQMPRALLGVGGTRALFRTHVCPPPPLITQHTPTSTAGAACVSRPRGAGAAARQPAWPPAHGARHTGHTTQRCRHATMTIHHVTTCQTQTSVFNTTRIVPPSRASGLQARCAVHHLRGREQKLCTQPSL